MYRRGAAKKEQSKEPVKDVSDLLVFGYACKLFRDDEKAVYHEQGKHLIPWMGDRSIMIDRYDGRGHLHDLSEYDSGSWNTSYQLSEEETRIEALCDEERYLALHTDLLQEEARQEEEYKRLSEALADEGSYNAVAFKYSADYYDPSQPTEEEDVNQESVEAEPEESEEPFVAPPGLAIPPDVELPATIKTHNIIERTASFVCQQGAQFEIVLKTKQSGNSQFDFLRFDHYLNPYYKHILRTMKEGRYNIASASQEPSQESNSDDSDEDGDGSYLHPSLFAPKKSSRLEELMKPLQVMDPDHPLAALVRKVRQEKNGTPAVAVNLEEASCSQSAQYTTDPNAAGMYYGYYMLPDGSYCLASPPPGVDATSYYNNMQTTIMAAPVSSEALSHLGTPSTSAELVTASSTVASTLQVFRSASPTNTPETSSKAETQASAPAAVAITPPPPDIQPVIDKLAEYVSRNGLKFEASVCAKNDPRFDFLQPWHQYNTYYEFKKNYFMQKEGKVLPQIGTVDDGDQLESVDAAKESQISKASFAPICFAIKSKENDLLPLEKNRVRLDDDSDEDKLLEDKGVEAVVSRMEMADKEPPPVSAAEEKRPPLSLEELEAKQAKQKLEDRLAAAAREKLAQASKESKEKQLQAERKRKAALFLQTLRGPFPGEPEVKRAEPDSCTQLELQEALFAFSEPAPPQGSPAHGFWQNQKFSIENYGPCCNREPPSCSSSSSSHATSRGPDGVRDRDRNRDRDQDRARDRARDRDQDRARDRDQDRARDRDQDRARDRDQDRARDRDQDRDRDRARDRDRDRDRDRARDRDQDRDRDRARDRDRDRTRGRDGDKERDKDRKKKKHKRRSRSRSRSRTKSRHSLPGAYRRGHHSKSCSRSPKRRDRRGPASDGRREDRDWERYHSRLPREHSRSRSPLEQQSSLSSLGQMQTAASSSSPYYSPRVLSSSASPSSSMTHSRGGSLEKDKAVSSSIVSSVQSKITQDLMAKVRAMLATSKTFQPPSS